jgi:hypothetical protein
MPRSRDCPVATIRGLGGWPFGPREYSPPVTAEAPLAFLQQDNAEGTAKLGDRRSRRAARTVGDRPFI